jgi:hypothetical protein
MRKKFPQVSALEHSKMGKYWQVSTRSKHWGMSGDRSNDSGLPVISACQAETSKVGS